METFSGTIIDPLNKKIFPGTITVNEGKIDKVTEDPSPKAPGYLLPGFIDAHIHIESSMLIPSEFARLATPHGTVATVSDPHEIANVLGIPGVEFMIENGAQVPFHFYFGASPCVPATSFETAGAIISPADIEYLFKKYDLKYLSEVMNYPGVIHKDPDMIAKIAVAKKYGKQVDGHAPEVTGENIKNYAAAGITTDHECVTLDEAIQKIHCGMSILIREGSAAKNFEALHRLIPQFPEKVMLCSDDKHAHELIKGHINELVKKAHFEKGYDLMDVLQAACVNPVLHYKLDTGLLQPGQSADFIRVDSLESFNVTETYIKGVLVAKNGKSLIKSIATTPLNKFNITTKKISDFKISAQNVNAIKVITPINGQLITESSIETPTIVEGEIVADPSRNILKIAVINRYNEAPPAIGFIKNFGLKSGAIASCIAHDSHNIIAVGCDDESLTTVVNAIIKNKGGIAIVDCFGECTSLPLPVAGIMSNESGFAVAEKHLSIENKAKQMGSTLDDPFMTLSFMALLVIPKLKLSDKGLFDGESFTFTSVTV